MVNTRHVCIYADRHGCGDREAHPYIASGGPVCDLHKPGAVTTPSPSAVATETVPRDLIALELTRRAKKEQYDASPKECRYDLYLAEKAVALHPWMAERKPNWREARKLLKTAVDAA